jgi:hypothetical protein
MTKIALAAAVLFGSASLSLAAALPQYDGDGNQIGSVYSVRQAPTGLENAFASSRPVAAPVGQRDGDGNPIPGAR